MSFPINSSEASVLRKVYWRNKVWKVGRDEKSSFPSHQYDDIYILRSSWCEVYNTITVSNFDIEDTQG